ncbi:MAG TPA: hypothetical protein VGK38_07405 [Prolixibacteraceae bacterium]|jgi:hypothetical protein
MKKICILILLINILSLNGFAQDKIIKITKDTIACQIKEIGEDEVKYTRKEFAGEVIFGIDKNKISKILFSDGKELTFKDSMYDPARYETQHKNALKVGFLSPLFGATSFTYEHSLKPGSSIEATLGIIGLGDDINGESSSGLYLKFGYKFIKSPDFYLKGMQYSHILKGAYIRPEVSFASYSAIPSVSDYNNVGVPPGTKENVTMFAIMINSGKQWVVNDRFLFDWFVGAGYGFSDAKNSNSFRFAFIGGGPDSKFVLTSGIRVGILF